MSLHGINGLWSLFSALRRDLIGNLECSFREDLCSRIILWVSSVRETVRNVYKKFASFGITVGFPFQKSHFANPRKSQAFVANAI